MALINLIGADLDQTTALLQQFLTIAVPADGSMTTSIQSVQTTTGDATAPVNALVQAGNGMADMATTSSRTLQADVTAEAAAGHQLTTSVTDGVGTATTKQQAAVSELQGTTAEMVTVLSAQDDFEQTSVQVLAGLNTGFQAMEADGKKDLDDATAAGLSITSQVKAEEANLQQRSSDADTLVAQLGTFCSEVQSPLVPQVLAQFSDGLQTDVLPPLSGAVQTVGAELQTALQALLSGANALVSDQGTTVDTLSNAAVKSGVELAQTAQGTAQQIGDALQTALQNLQRAGQQLQSDGKQAQALAACFPPVENAALSLHALLQQGS